jgi:hypothetical protein
MDILHLVDRLEELFNESRSIPFTHSVIVDEDRMLDLIDQMRVSVPDEIKKAQIITTQKERYMAQAQEEASRITAQAREKSEQMMLNDPLIKSTKERAEQIVAQARMEGEATKKEADEYVIDTLRRLEIELERSLTQIRNGIHTLRTDKDSLPGSGDLQ